MVVSSNSVSERGGASRREQVISVKLRTSSYVCLRVKHRLNFVRAPVTTAYVFSVTTGHHHDSPRHKQRDFSVMTRYRLVPVFSDRMLAMPCSPVRWRWLRPLHLLLLRARVRGHCRLPPCGQLETDACTSLGGIGGFGVWTSPFESLVSRRCVGVGGYDIYQ